MKRKATQSVYSITDFATCRRLSCLDFLKVDVFPVRSVGVMPYRIVVEVMPIKNVDVIPIEKIEVFPIRFVEVNPRPRNGYTSCYLVIGKVKLEDVWGVLC